MLDLEGELRVRLHPARVGELRQGGLLVELCREGSSLELPGAGPRTELSHKSRGNPEGPAPGCLDSPFTGDPGPHPSSSFSLILLHVDAGAQADNLGVPEGIWGLLGPTPPYTET